MTFNGSEYQTVPNQSIANIVSRMAKAGAPAEAIAIAVEAIEQSRVKTRERVRRFRAKRNVTVTLQTRNGNAPPSLSSFPPKTPLPSFPSSFPVSSFHSETGAEAAPKDSALKEPLPQAEFFKRIRQVCGPNAGVLGKKLLDFKQGNVALARALLENASTKGEPHSYLWKVVRGENGQSEPEVVRQGRRNGEYVEKLQETPPRWKVGTWIYDERGHEMGF